ncbi:acyl-CoA thioesterase [Bordetella genomosp. 12]|uniref:Thioesterase n=1 Tax=Bordetella genomosp. 12 TaxID=463035 RepID=A0A261VEI3_9BORD|nr:acyl-CoA thioesterase [Bordetella genomosp. 12]OZI71990.1 hypothetical protein CAL22_19625 [Bordetella genomosp. 12]
MTLISYESVISATPFVVRRRVRWGECDPAGVVYTGKFVDYMLAAVNLFYANLAPVEFRQLLGELGIGMPCRGLDMDFRGALWPEDEFEIRVGVQEIRRSTFDMRVHGYQEGGRDIFLGRFSAICIPGDGQRKSVAIPAALRSLLESHTYET